MCSVITFHLFSNTPSPSCREVAVDFFGGYGWKLFSLLSERQKINCSLKILAHSQKFSAQSEYSVLFGEFLDILAPSLFSLSEYFSDAREIFCRVKDNEFSETQRTLLKFKDLSGCRLQAGTSVKEQFETIAASTLLSLREPSQCVVYSCIASTVTRKICRICKVNCHIACSYAGFQIFELEDGEYEFSSTTCSQQCWDIFLLICN